MSDYGIPCSTEIVPQVPLNPPSYQQHECKATRVAYVHVLANSNKLQNLTAEFSAIIGKIPDATSSPQKTTWSISTLDPDSHPRIILGPPLNHEEEAHLKEKGSGIYEIGIIVDSSQPAGIVSLPDGKLVWCPEA